MRQNSRCTVIGAPPEPAGGGGSCTVNVSVRHVMFSYAPLKRYCFAFAWFRTSRYVSTWSEMPDVIV